MKKSLRESEISDSDYTEADMTENFMLLTQLPANTGDNAPIKLCIAIIAIAAVVGIAMFIISKKKK